MVEIFNQNVLIYILSLCGMDAFCYSIALQLYFYILLGLFEELRRLVNHLSCSIVASHSIAFIFQWLLFFRAGNLKAFFEIQG